MRDTGDHRPRDRRRRDHDQGVRSTTRRSCATTIKDIGYTRAKYGFDAETCASCRHRRAVARHRAGRRYGTSCSEATRRSHGGAGDQGLMFGYACTETRRADAAADHAGAQAGQGTVDRAPRRRARLSPPGRQVAGVGVEYDERQAGACRHGRGLDPAQRRCDRTRRSSHDITSKFVEPVIPANLRDGKTRFLTSTRPDVSWSAARTATRPHRPQDHRRHLRRRGPARRRRVLGQGSDKGRPLGVLHGPLRRQERRRGRPGGSLPVQLAYAIGVAEPVSRAGRHRRHRQGRRREDRAKRSKELHADARRGSSRRSTCGVRSTARPRPTATSAATEPEFTWEKTDKADALRADAGLAVASPARP